MENPRELEDSDIQGRKRELGPIRGKTPYMKEKFLPF